MKSTVLNLQNLSAGYNGEDVIRDISFDVGAGEIFALVGESGSGKSTVLKSIMGLPSNRVRTSRGEITFNGRNLTELSTEERRNLLGDELCTVFQNPATSMNPIRKIRGQFLDTMRSHKRFDDEKSLAALRTAFIKIGLGDADRVLDCCPFELSGGCVSVLLWLWLW